MNATVHPTEMQRVRRGLGTNLPLATIAERSRCVAAITRMSTLIVRVAPAIASTAKRRSSPRRNPACSRNITTVKFRHRWPPS
jgi:hypothetical protein